ncbi:hypothetical protein Kurepalu1_00008 [Pseudomonas phage vB_PpuP-Kurepalu-1]
MATTIKDVVTTERPGGGNVSARSLNGGLCVSLAEGNFQEFTVPAIPQATPYVSATFTLPAPRTRMGVIAYYWQSVVATSGSNISIEWSSEQVNWYPAPVSTTGDTRIASTTASGGAGSDDRVLLTRGQPMHRYFRVRISAGTAAGLPGGKLFVNWGPVV